MLTGHRVFAGEDVTEFVVSVMTKEPDWSQLPATTPPQIADLLHRCLRKDPRERLRDIGDGRIVLEDSSELAWVPPAQSGTKSRRSARVVLPWALLLTISVALFAFGWQLMTEDVPLRGGPPAAQFEVDLPHVVPIGTDFALSADGRDIAYIGSTADGRPVLYRRSLRDISVHELVGTEGANYPFFSPDGEWVGFHADGELRRIPTGGGRPTVICRSPEAVGASWSTDDYIVFGTPSDGLFRVSASGGTPSRLTSPRQQGEAHTFPQVLPDAKTVVFGIVPIDGSGARVGVLSLDHPEEWTTIIDGFSPTYAATGHLLFARSGRLMAVPFHAGDRRVAGEPIVVVEQLSTGDPRLGWASYKISAAGQLAWLAGPDQLSTSTLVWVNRQGKVRPVLENQTEGYLQPAVSPKGDRLAVARYDPSQAVQLWTHDQSDGRSAPVVLEQSSLSNWPVWSPDGKWIAFVSNRAGGYNVFRTSADGSGQVEQLTFDSILRTTPTSWSVDDVLAIERGPIGRRDIMVLPVRSGAKPEPIIATESNERGAKFSPDGRWLAFTSDRSGRDEVWVKRYPGADPPVLISIGGGKEPAWSRDGRELFYRSASRVLAVTVVTQPTFRAGKPATLFEGDYTYGYLDWSFNYDVARDGEFVMVKEGLVPKLQMIVNWFDELKRVAPPR
jgi:serine/threonine-protein kinase